MATKKNRSNRKLSKAKDKYPDWNWDYWVHQFE